MTASEKAAAYLLKVIKKHSTPGAQQRLPSVKKMAEECRVSLVTMWKTINRFKLSGAIQVIPGGGIFVSRDDGRTGPVVPAADSRTQTVQEQIFFDILSGAYLPGMSLPTIKGLCRRYGSSYLTIKQSLQSLSKKGRIVPFRRGYRVFRPVSYGSSATIMLVAYTDNMGALINSTPRSMNFWRVLEGECTARSLNLEVLSHEQACSREPDSDGRLGPMSKVDKKNIVLGYIVLTVGIIEPNMERLLSLLIRTEKPVSILDEEGRFTQYLPQSIIRHHAACRLFTMGLGERAGTDVANFLLGTGHRHIACFIPSAGSAYEPRLNQLLKSFIPAGHSSQVAMFYGPPSVDVFQKVSSNSPLAGVQQCYFNLEKELSQQPEFLRRSFSLSNIVQYMQALQLQIPFSLLFEKALKDPTITAWVAMTDYLALSALSYLHHKRIPVPQRISVAGFDDSIEAFGMGLTSYSFNVPAVVNAMLEHVITPDKKSRQGHDEVRPIEIPGMMMVRTSTRIISQQPPATKEPARKNGSFPSRSKG